MLEPKFRAWDRELKEMLQMEVKENQIWFGDVNVFSEILNDRERFLLLQFTGLLDKNGIEIYEGNVIRLFGVNVIERSDPNPILRIVRRSSDRPELRLVGIDGKERSGFIFCESNGKHFEVIGDEFRNPELIERGEDVGSKS